MAHSVLPGCGSITIAPRLANIPLDGCALSRADAALIEVFASKYGAERTVAAFSRVGLSEAFVFLKPFGLLSRGQQYRAMIADLMLRDDPVWLIDEFCADLDPVAASIVAHNLRKIGNTRGTYRHSGCS
jgi:ABC-type ATPase with predicted acetyltransferase domain